jgi:hypothetical protein
LRHHPQSRKKASGFRPQASGTAREEGMIPLKQTSGLRLQEQPEKRNDPLFFLLFLTPEA